MSTTTSSVSWGNIYNNLTPILPLLKLIAVTTGMWMVVSNLVHIGLANRRGVGVGGNLVGIA